MVEVTQDGHRWVGMALLDQEGTKVGKVADVYLDRNSRRPDWALVQSGLLGSHRLFVPLTGCLVDDDGVHVAFTKRVIEAAPQVGSQGQLSPGEEDTLYRHYGLEAALPADQGGLPEPPPPVPVVRRTADESSDGTMTRSEEEIEVHTVSRPSEIVRLRKYVVTEETQVTVPLRREEVRIERIPLTDEMVAALPAGTAGTEIGLDGSTELILLEEQVVVTKKVVPRERVWLAKEIVTEQQDVTDEIRKERVDLEHLPIGPDGRPAAQ